jgi:predicted phosphodiesterase
MRLAILADVHSNLSALEAVLADVGQHDIEGMVVAGDHVSGGPQPLETMRLLSTLDGWLIRGNADDRLVAYDAGVAPHAWRESNQWAAMRWTYEHLDRASLDYLTSLPEQCVVAPPGSPPIRVVHGSPTSPTESLYPDRDPPTLHLFRRAGLLAADRRPTPLDRALAQVDESALICGHSHIPWAQRGNGRLALNPGSVGSPVNGDVRAQYAILAWEEGRWEVTFRAVPYDLARTRAAFYANGLLVRGGAFARAVLRSMETGQNVAGHFVSYASRLAAEAGAQGGSVLSDEIWERAAATFDWEAYGTEEETQ